MSSIVFTLSIHRATDSFKMWLCSSLTLQPIWPSWLWSWPASFWTKAGRSSPRSSAPKTTSRCSGSFSSSSRKCRPQSHRRPETSPQRSLSFVRVSRSHQLLVSDKMKIKLHKSWTIFVLFPRFCCPGQNWQQVLWPQTCIQRGGGAGHNREGTDSCQETKGMCTVWWHTRLDFCITWALVCSLLLLISHESLTNIMFVCETICDSKKCLVTDQAAASLFQAEGYTDGDMTLFHSFTVMAFLKADNPVDFLGKASEVRTQVHLQVRCRNAAQFSEFSWESCYRQEWLVPDLSCFFLTNFSSVKNDHTCSGFVLSIQITFDNKDLESHQATSAEIKECCRDIKVLGRKELRWAFTLPAAVDCAPVKGSWASLEAKQNCKWTFVKLTLLQ